MYSTLPHTQIYPNQNGRRVRLSSELDLDYTPLTTPIVIETSQAEVGPICASSPKRSMSAFTTFGPNSNRSTATTPNTTGHLV